MWDPKISVPSMTQKLFRTINFFFPTTKLWSRGQCVCHTLNACTDTRIARELVTELCHLVDILQTLLGSKVRSVF